MAQSSSTPLKPCTICQSESSIVVPSLAAPKNFCLLHYFGTGIHRKRSKNKRSKLFVHPLRLKSQLSDVQDLFSEAFVELQKEIREESVRGLDLNLNLDSAELRNFGRRYGKGNNSRKSGDVSNNDENNNDAEFEDPLAALLDAGTPSHHRRMLGMKGIKISSAGNAKASSSSTSMNGTDSNARPKHTNHSSNPSAAARTRTKFTRQQRDEDIAGEGGFIREAALPDKLRKFQENAAIDLDLNHWQNNATKKNSDGLEASSEKSGSGRVPVAVSKSSVNSNSKTAGSSKPSNPYNPTKRRNRTSTWNQVLNSTSPTHEHDKDGDRELSGHDQPSKKPKKTSWEEMEKQMIQNITSTSTSAPCNSNNNNAVIASGPKCTSCASTNIESHGNITSRNNDVRKGEVWGMKDRGEMVVERYRCLNCGKVWNQE